MSVSFNFFFPLLGSVLCASSLIAEEKLLFQDDFERSESDDSKEEIGKGWSSNSVKRAKGNKQVDLKDGAMHITFHPEADHAVSVVHPAGFRDGRVALRFMLPNKEDSLKLNFADLKFKEVHAGHLCAATVYTNGVQLEDLKEGRMAKEVREAAKEKRLTTAQKKLIQSKKKRFKKEIAPGKWHEMEVKIVGDVMTVKINGEEVGRFASAGIAHPSKRTLRLGIPRKAIVDDLKIYQSGH
jgi:hypothetical protein